MAVQKGDRTKGVVQGLGPNGEGIGVVLVAGGSFRAHFDDYQYSNPRNGDVVTFIPEYNCGDYNAREIRKA
jgi:hypothetical protein